jgi:hypothetical protein
MRLHLGRRLQSQVQFCHWPFFRPLCPHNPINPDISPIESGTLAPCVPAHSFLCNSEPLHHVGSECAPVPVGAGVWYWVWYMYLWSPFPQYSALHAPFFKVTACDCPQHYQCEVQYISTRYISCSAIDDDSEICVIERPKRVLTLLWLQARVFWDSALSICTGWFGCTTCRVGG